jgi:hypothetical protein
MSLNGSNREAFRTVGNARSRRSGFSRRIGEPRFVGMATALDAHIKKLGREKWSSKMPRCGSNAVLSLLFTAAVAPTPCRLSYGCTRQEHRVRTRAREAGLR